MNLKRILAAALLMCAALSVCRAPAWADENVASVTTKGGNTTNYTDVHAALEAAQSAASGGWDTTSVDVNILKDITFKDSAKWTPVTFNVLNPITINGNNHKITNKIEEKINH